MLYDKSNAVIIKPPPIDQRKESAVVDPVEVTRDLLRRYSQILNTLLEAPLAHNTIRTLPELDDIVLDALEFTDFLRRIRGETDGPYVGLLDLQEFCEEKGYSKTITTKGWGVVMHNLPSHVGVYDENGAPLTRRSYHAICSKQTYTSRGICTTWTVDVHLLREFASRMEKAVWPMGYGIKFDHKLREWLATFPS